MKNLRAGFFLLFVSALTACSSESPQKTSVNAADSTRAANSVAAPPVNASVANSTSSQTVVLAPGTEKIDPNAFNKSVDENARVIPVDPKNDKTTSGIYGRTAPDDSTFNATMDAKGMMMEVRTFNNHPVLAKVERVFTSPNKTIKVYLKNGKVISLSEDKLENFAAVAPANILLAAGVDGRPKPDADAQKNEQKQEDSTKKQ